MKLSFQVASANELEEIHAFASRRLESRVPDETQRAFASWVLPWRRESLEHYMKLGWSFIARTEASTGILETRGFFLAQTFLFVRGQTQTLWVEHVEAADAETRSALVDIAVRVAREKHLQRVLFNDNHELQSDLDRWQGKPLTSAIVEIMTTKG